MEERVIKAALLGLGTVGTGVYKVLQNQEEEMTAKIGCKVNDNIFSTDIDPTWSHVEGITYALYSGAHSWRYIYFYVKDKMYMCTFLF